MRLISVDFKLGVQKKREKMQNAIQKQTQTEKKNRQINKET